MSIISFSGWSGVPSQDPSLISNSGIPQRMPPTQAPGNQWGQMGGGGQAGVPPMSGQRAPLHGAPQTQAQVQQQQAQLAQAQQQQRMGNQAPPYRGPPPNTSAPQQTNRHHSPATHQPPNPTLPMLNQGPMPGQQAPPRQYPGGTYPPQQQIPHQQQQLPPQQPPPQQQQVVQPPQPPVQVQPKQEIWSGTLYLHSQLAPDVPSDGLVVALFNAVAESTISKQLVESWPTDLIMSQLLPLKQFQKLQNSKPINQKIMFRITGHNPAASALYTGAVNHMNGSMLAIIEHPTDLILVQLKPMDLVNQLPPDVELSSVMFLGQARTILTS
eukprot:gene11070-18677_t